MHESLVSRLLAHASSHPDDAAIVDERGTVAYGELARGVLSVAARLHALGVRRGDTLALCFGAPLQHTADFASVVYGAGRLGAVLLPLYPDVPEGRSKNLVSRFGARLAVGVESADLGTTTLLLSDICDKSHISSGDTPRGDAAALPYLYQFSSGTSGNPKAVLFSHSQTVAFAAALVGRYGWKRGDRLIPPLPAPGKVGLRYLFRMLFAGGTLINTPFPTSRQQLADKMRALGANAAGATPWQLRRLLASPPAAAEPPRLGFLESIGATIAAAEIEALRREVTPHLHVNYSSTESGLVATLPPGDAPGDGHAPIDGMEVQIVDAAGSRLAAGAAGAIRLRAPWLPSAYAGNDAETAKRFHDGWFYPGDFGYLDARGRLFVRGRDDGAINFGGVKVVPEEVEAVLLTHPGVADAVVTAVPNAMAGEIPVAFVVLHPPATLEAIKVFCATHLDADSVPAAILSLERMPRTADGKVERARLKEHARSLAHMFHST